MKPPDVFCLNGVWVETADFWPMGRPETSVELPGDVTLGLYVPHPFGPGSDAMLQIHAVAGNGNDGGTITLAIGTLIERTTRRMDMTLLSGPQRHGEDDCDFQKGHIE